MKAAVATALLALALGGTGLAQSEPPERRRGRQPRQEVFKMVDAYVVKNLKAGLGLTDEQYERVLPLVTRLQTDRRELAQRRVRALGELRKVLRSGGATEAEVTGLLREVKAAEAEELSIVRADREAVDAALTPLQQAKFRVLEAEVEQRLRELMAEMRARRGRGGNRRPRQQD